MQRNCAAMEYEVVRLVDPTVQRRLRTLSEAAQGGRCGRQSPDSVCQLRSACRTHNPRICCRAPRNGAAE